ncbi:MAG: glycine--tRNA ligase subunit beta [Anaerolineaceae bacterium]|nr:glycine--tRNA ligase subunit beta [Anaerolineaceae bacterium]
MENKIDFQSMIMKLQEFWGQQGCLIWQPYNNQVGAGTYNPATSLRVLGPEPWNVGYVEPSVRPDDGRYGENPYRLQQHYQFQVILKPDPGNPQELYLKSLLALGIDPRMHDIRFVEDNWESPALGAWGLGWEVWLDGQEITQFTYFQQAGGRPADPVAVEITYGLERIAMPLQLTRHFTEIQWSKDLTYGDVNYLGEKEHSTYYFEIADVDRLRKMYDLFEAEAHDCLDKGLVLPAHDYVLKCSHTFNVLDTRGAVGVTERQALFRRMRDLSRRVADTYLAQREEIGFPWLEKDISVVGRKEFAEAVKDKARQTEAADLVFEIGTEELPAGDMQAALHQIEEKLPKLLEGLHLEHGSWQVLGTPRRLVIHVKDLQESQEDRTSVVKGPPANRAFDTEGKPTKAAEGFARGKGVDVNSLEVKEIDGGQYVVAVVHEKGQRAVEVLAKSLPELLGSIRFDKTMRWNAGKVTFSRPIRWLFALFGCEVIPFSYASLHTSRITRGLRFSEHEEINIENPYQYFNALRKQGILLDPNERRLSISEQVRRLSEDVGGDENVDDNLLEEVIMLVEAPTAFRGTYDEAHLELPADVLISVMKKHQRYFPVQHEDGSLMPYFIGVRNGDNHHLETVVAGNEHVIRARFEDAAFFIHEDSKKPLSAYLERLNTLTFQKDLGSMFEKSQRLEKLVEELIPMLDLNKKEEATLKRSAKLCKADLVTNMVVEMTSLQGVIGRYYAVKSGESEEVAESIYEHYLPRFAGDILPQSKPGLLLSIADRLDSLMGLFAAGLAPSGTKDPFALRRAALGLIQILVEKQIDFDLSAAIAKTAAFLPLESSIEQQDACLDFIVGRMRNNFLDQGLAYDSVDAVLVVQKSNPSKAMIAVQHLMEWVKREDWSIILPAYSRCVRITRDLKETYKVDTALFSEKEENDLFAAIQKIEEQEMVPGSVDDLFNAFLPIIPVINQFFDSILVMAENEDVKHNRLGLLQRVSALSRGVADLSHLEGF